MNKFILLVLITLYSTKVFGINPEKNHQYTPEEFGIKKYDRLIVKTSDNYKIFTCTFYPIKSWNSKTIIICYGDAGNMSYYYYYIRKLTELGLRVIAFDYRGFGKSSEFPAINKNMLYHTEFTTDLITVIKYAKRDKLNKGVGIMAFSMGTIITTLALKHEKIDFIIAESYVTDLKLVIQRLKIERAKNVLLPKEVTNSQYHHSIKKVQISLLIFSGIKDKITTINDTELLSKNNEKCTIERYNGDHGMGLMTLGNDYFKKIGLFFKNLTRKKTGLNITKSQPDLKI